MPVIPIAASAALGYGLYSAGKVGSKQTLSLNMPEATPQERRAAGLSEAAQRANIQSAGYDIKENPDGTIELVQKPLTEQQVLENQIAKTVNERLLNYFQGGSFLSPEQKAAIESQYATGTKQGQEDIGRAFKDLESTRGIPITETSPTGSALARELARFGETMSTARLAALAGGETSGLNFANTVRQFQEGLKQQDLLAKMTAAQPTTQTALTLAGLRYGSAGRTATSFAAPLDTLIRGIGATGGLMTGLGGMGLKLA